MSARPTKCDTCQASLGRGYSYVYEHDKLVSAICFACEKVRALKEYQETKVLRSNFLMEAVMSLYDMYGTPIKEAMMKPGYDTSELEKIRLDYLNNHKLPYIDAYISNRKIFAKIKLFESAVWFKGLQALIRPATGRGFSAKLDGLTVLTYSMCGRCMITIEDDKSSVSMLCDESSSESTMGDRGICATEDQATDILRRATDGYVRGQLVFAPDKEVSYI